MYFLWHSATFHVFVEAVISILKSWALETVPRLGEQTFLYNFMPSEQVCQPSSVAAMLNQILPQATVIKGGIVMICRVGYRVDLSQKYQDTDFPQRKVEEDGP